MATVEVLKLKYPGADAWQMGDSPELASKLADLIKKGIKTASCGSLTSYLLPLTSRKSLRRRLVAIILSLMARTSRPA